jgi:hypothetical protein
MSARNGKQPMEPITLRVPPDVATRFKALTTEDARAAIVAGLAAVRTVKAQE